MKTLYPTKYAALLFALLLFFTTNAQELTKVSPEEVGMSSERLNFLSQTFQDYIDENELPGAAILVARKGKTAYFEIFGKNDLENNVPMTKNSIFRIASQTKAIVSVGIMILQEQGKLLITDPVGKYIPAFMETKVAVSKDNGSYDIVEANRPITIRDLLTHTSGVSYGQGIASDLWEEAKIQGWYFADRDEPILATVTRMAELPFESQPGERLFMAITQIFLVR